MDDKPIIRHCFNCRYCIRSVGLNKCDVYYDYIHSPRSKAIFCKYYKQKELESEVK